MNEFEINVIRMRYGKKTPFGTDDGISRDEVVVDVDELGRAKVPLTYPMGSHPMVGGSMCYGGWKLVTGIPLNPGKVYKIKFTASLIGEGKYTPPSTENDDLVPIEEQVAQQAKEDKLREEYAKKLREAKKAAKGE